MDTIEDSVLKNYFSHVPFAMKDDFLELITLMETIAPEAVVNFQLGIPYFCQNNQLIYGIAAREDHIILYYPTLEDSFGFSSRLKQATLGNGCISFRRLANINVNILSELLALIKVNASRKIH